MKIIFTSQFDLGDLVTMKGMAALNPTHCQAFRVEGIVYCWDSAGEAVCYKLRVINPPRRWGDEAMSTSCDRYVYGGHGLPESELCKLPEESRQLIYLGKEAKE